MDIAAVLIFFWLQSWGLLNKTQSFRRGEGVYIKTPPFFPWSGGVLPVHFFWTTSISTILGGNPQG